MYIQYKVDSGKESDGEQLLQIKIYKSSLH